MERRVLLAISLSFLVLFLYQALFVPAPPPAAGNVTTQIPSAQSSPASPASSEPAGAVAPAAVPSAPPVVGDSDARDITVETALVRAVFTNRGARLRHWILKDYRNDRGEPLDLVPEKTPEGFALPFALRVDDASATASLNTGLYRVSGAGGANVDATSAPVSLTFDLETADGLAARKTFAFEPSSFVVQVSVTVQHGGQPLNPTIDWGPGLGDDIARTRAGSFLSPNYTYQAQAIYYTAGSVERVSAANLAGGAVREGEFRWAGVDDH
jgi:YidC/Oxa1 family membrane protein insertase